MSGGEFSAALESSQKRVAEWRQALLEEQRKTAAQFARYSQHVETQRAEFGTFRAKASAENQKQLSEAAATVAQMRKTLEEAESSKIAFERNLQQLERRLFRAAATQPEETIAETTQRFGWTAASAARDLPMAVLPVHSPPTMLAKEAEFKRMFFASDGFSALPHAAETAQARPSGHQRSQTAVAGWGGNAHIDLTQSIEREMSLENSPPRLHLASAPQPPIRPPPAQPPVFRADAALPEQGSKGFSTTNLRRNVERISENSYKQAQLLPEKTGGVRAIPSQPASQGALPFASTQPLKGLKDKKSAVSRDGFESFESLRNASKAEKARRAPATSIFAPKPPKADQNDFDDVISDF